MLVSFSTSEVHKKNGNDYLQIRNLVRSFKGLPFLISCLQVTEDFFCISLLNLNIEDNTLCYPLKIITVEFESKPVSSYSIFHDSIRTSLSNEQKKRSNPLQSDIIIPFFKQEIDILF